MGSPSSGGQSQTELCNINRGPRTFFSEAVVLAGEVNQQMNPRSGAFPQEALVGFMPLALMERRALCPRN